MASFRSPPGQSWSKIKSYAHPNQAPYIHPLPTPPAEVPQPLHSFDEYPCNVVATVAFPPSMVHGGPDSMGAPSSFTARRPNASNLPNFELPPPPLSGFGPKYTTNLQTTTQPTTTSTTLTSVGNLLTPPSNGSADGLSPISTGVSATGAISNQSTLQSYTPNGGMWPPPTTASTTPYGFQSVSGPQPFGQRGAIFSPSLNSLVRSNSSPTAGDSLPPPPFELSHYQASMSMSNQNLQQPMSGVMAAPTPVSASVTQPAPVHSQEAYARPPPTPTYYNASQPSSTPQQPTFPYSTGPSPVQQSPISAGGSMTKMSPMNTHGPIPPLHTQQSQYAPHRYTYPLTGPVLSNVSNPGGQLALVGGLPNGMMHSGFNSGHAAQMQHLYGHQASHQQNDRPFRCDQCPQSFNRNHDLKRHKRIHLAVKPFPCGHCDKSFSRKDALKVRTSAVSFMASHANVHVETRPRQGLRQSVRHSRHSRNRRFDLAEDRKRGYQSSGGSICLRIYAFLPFDGCMIESPGYFFVLSSRDVTMEWTACSEGLGMFQTNMEARKMLRKACIDLCAGAQSQAPSTLGLESSPFDD